VAGTRVRVRIEINYAGIGELAKGAPLRTDLARRAFAVRAAALANAPEMQTGQIEVEASTRTGSDRVRGIVTARHPGVVHAEAKHRFLGQAIDAAGD
jgi:hypothetical protein